MAETKAGDRQVAGTHYTSMGVEPWDALPHWLGYGGFRGFLAGNVVKYMARAGRKGPAINDYKKAAHYLERLIELEEEGA